MPEYNKRERGCSAMTISISSEERSRCRRLSPLRLLNFGVLKRSESMTDILPSLQRRIHRRGPEYFSATKDRSKSFPMDQKMALQLPKISSISSSPINKIYLHSTSSDNHNDHLFKAKSLDRITLPQISGDVKQQSVTTTTIKPHKATTTTTTMLKSRFRRTLAIPSHQHNLKIGRKDKGAEESYSLGEGDDGSNEYDVMYDDFKIEELQEMGLF